MCWVHPIRLGVSGLCIPNPTRVYSVYTRWAFCVQYTCKPNRVYTFLCAGYTPFGWEWAACVYQTRLVCIVCMLLGLAVYALRGCFCVYITGLLCIHSVDLCRRVCTNPEFLHISTDVYLFVHSRRKMYTAKIDFPKIYTAKTPCTHGDGCV